MSHKGTIINYLNAKDGYYCDDCLSKCCYIFPRQTIYQLCTDLSRHNLINRQRRKCDICAKEKIVNSRIESGKNNNELTIKNSNDNIGKKLNVIYNSDKFLEINLEFDNFNIINIFSKYKTHTLEEVLNKDKYLKLSTISKTKYSEYLKMELGLFLKMLKLEGDLFYKKFLNPYGDLIYCKFKMVDNEILRNKGIYVFKNNTEIKYIGRVLGNFDFYQRINFGYANISPKNCFLDGQATNCHINSLINSIKGDVQLYILPLENDEDIIRFERLLINLIRPEWNIALK